MEKSLPVKGKRILSIDQFRGFAILGMILVNYLGYFDVIPLTFKHPRYGMTFANAIAPYFIFVVGMGFRMSFQRRIQNTDKSKTYLLAAKRYIILILIGIVLYGPDPVCDMWDALVDIGFGGLLVLPFIMTGKTIRYMVALFYLCLHQLLFVFTPYGEWTMANSIDGGPLGILPWASILIFGTILIDYLLNLPSGKFIRNSLILGGILMVSGILISRLQPSEWWQFSQRSMTIAYPLLSSGLSVLTYLLFYILNDIRKIELPHLTTLGYNALTIYIVQQVLIVFYGSYLPKTAMLWQTICGFVIIYLLCYIVAYFLKRNNYLIKI